MRPGKPWALLAHGKTLTTPDCSVTAVGKAQHTI
eukprot:SAG31_NODE_8397_length_1459_cov_1.169118_1_plen_33_part_10